MREERWLAMAPVVVVAVLASGGLGFAISNQLFPAYRRFDPPSVQTDEERNQEIIGLCTSSRRDAQRLIARYISEMEDRSVRVDYLTMAAGAGRQDIVQTLEAIGYPVTGVLQNNAPVFGAVKTHHVELVRYLLARGASVRTRPSAVPSPFPTVIFSNDLAMLLCLLDAGANVDDEFPLWGNVFENRYLRLHQEGIDVRRESITPLIYAAIVNRSDMMLALLHHGANRTFRTPQGLTALDYARRLGSRECVAVLSGKGL
jgi:hypothetical protein